LIEIYDPESRETGEEIVTAQFPILDTKYVVASTRVLREVMAQAMAGSNVAATVDETLSRIVVMVSHDDIYVIFDCGAPGSNDPPDVNVRYIDLAYALSEFPPAIRTIASSPDDYFEKSLAHLAKTLERETYWW
jgi:hypothetical protein